MALTEEKQSKLSLDFKYLKDKAIIDFGKEDKRSVLRGVKQHRQRSCAANYLLPFLRSMLFWSHTRHRFFLKDDLLLLQ